MTNKHSVKRARRLRRQQQPARISLRDLQLAKRSVNSRRK